MDRKQYLEAARKGANEEALSFEEFVEHFGVQNANPSAGIAVGECVPDIALPDQDGNLRRVATLAGPGGTLLVFVRSVNWCGYCRNQLAELNLAVDAASARGVQIVAIAPDHPELIGEFSRFAKLRYPVLGDVAGDTFEAFHILNTNVPPETIQTSTKHEISGRIPFPAHFLVSADGVVLAKKVSDDLRHRPSGTALLFDAFGASDESVAVRIETDDLTAQVTLSSGCVQTGQEIALGLTITPRAGLHVYGPSAPAGYVPLSITLDPALAVLNQISFPPEKLLRLEAVGETLPIYDEAITARGTIRLNWSPPVHGSRHLRGIEDRLAAMQMAPGTYRLEGTLSYQACTDATCFPPRSIAFSLPLEVLADVDKVAPVFKSEWEEASAETSARSDNRKAHPVAERRFAKKRP